MPRDTPPITRSGMPAYIGMILGPCALAAGIFFLSPPGAGILDWPYAIGLICAGVLLLFVGIRRIASFGRRPTDANTEDM